MFASLRSPLSDPEASLRFAVISLAIFMALTLALVLLMDADIRRLQRATAPRLVVVTSRMKTPASGEPAGVQAPIWDLEA